jgi:hypothetical protein
MVPKFLKKVTRYSLKGLAKGGCSKLQLEKGVTIGYHFTTMYIIRKQSSLAK